MRWFLTAMFVWGIAGAARFSSAEDKPDPIHILLTVGGHGFQEEPFYAMFDALPGIKVTKAEMPRDARRLRPGLQKEYDVVVMYDMVTSISADEQQRFVELLQQGIGLVSLHHNLGAHRNWDEFARIIGGKFLFGDVVLEGKSYKPSTWSHGELLPVKVADPTHAITQGVTDFEIRDETYGGFYTASDVHVLLTTEHPKNAPHIAWTKTYGNSRVFYLMLGHDAKAWAHPSYPKLLEQGIRWAANK